jgi:hypothetical protein
MVDRQSSQTDKKEEVSPLTRATFFSTLTGSRKIQGVL